MRLLILTQTIDKTDSTLGFFHRWVEELSGRVDHILVFALRRGIYVLPKNVKVESLRASAHDAQLGTAVRVLTLAWKHRHEYDAVFVHMNQEYLLVAGWLWKLMGKRVYLWRNHYAGNFITDVASVFCDKIFHTSKSSYTAKYKRARLMPVGVDTSSLHPDEPITKKPHSVLFFGRFDRSKRPDLLVEALGLLKKEGIPFTATFAGGPSNPVSTYPQEVATRANELGIAERVTFIGAVRDTEKYRYFRSHEVYVNASKSGMLDKTIFEAIASGAVPLSASTDMAEIVGREFSYTDGDATDLAHLLKKTLSLSQEKRKEKVARLSAGAVAPHRLEVLADALVREMA